MKLSVLIVCFTLFFGCNSEVKILSEENSLRPLTKNEIDCFSKTTYPKYDSICNDKDIKNLFIEFRIHHATVNLDQYKLAICHNYITIYYGNYKPVLKVPVSVCNKSVTDGLTFYVIDEKSNSFFYWENKTVYDLNDIKEIEVELLPDSKIDHSNDISFRYDLKK